MEPSQPQSHFNQLSSSASNVPWLNCCLPPFITPARYLPPPPSLFLSLFGSVTIHCELCKISHIYEHERKAFLSNSKRVNRERVIDEPWGMGMGNRKGGMAIRHGHGLSTIQRDFHLSLPLTLGLFLGSNSTWYVHKVKLFMASYTWYSISSTIHTPRRGQKPFWPHLNVSFFVSFFSPLFLCVFSLFFLYFFLQFFVSFVTIYEYVWIVLMKCSAKCTRLLNLFDLEFIVVAPLSFCTVVIHFGGCHLVVPR